LSLTIYSLAYQVKKEEILVLIENKKLFKTANNRENRDQEREIQRDTPKVYRCQKNIGRGTNEILHLIVYHGNSGRHRFVQGESKPFYTI